MEIGRNAGALLKPNIPILVTALLEAASGLEPDVINYLSLQLGSQASQDKVREVDIKKKHHVLSGISSLFFGFAVDVTCCSL